MTSLGTKLLNIRHNGIGYEVFNKDYFYLGDIVAKEDGFYDWWPESSNIRGCWPAPLLRELADTLDELNASWQKTMDEYFEKVGKV